MNPNANILGSHGRDELISSNSSLIRFNQYSVEVVGVTRSFFRRRRKKQRKSAQLALVGSPNLLPSLPIGFNAAKLMDPDRGLDVHHIVLEATLHDVVVFVSCIAEPPPCVLAHAVEGENLEPTLALLVRCQNHSPFARCHVLGHVEAEAAKPAERPRVPASIRGFDSVRAIFDQNESVAFRREGLSSAR